MNHHLTWRRAAGEPWRDRMTKRIEEAARDRLVSRRRTIEQLYRSVGEAEADVDPVQLDDVDRADNRTRSELLHRLSERERRELQEIDAALGRIDNGSYGRCEACKGPIGNQRLTAMPEARLCVACSSVAAQV